MNFYSKLVPIDTEYNRSKDRNMNLVSVSYMVDGVKFNRWLYKNPIECQKFRNHINSLKNDHIFIAHNWVADGRALQSIGIDILSLRCICTFVEHRMITNHNDRMMFKKQLIKGNIVHTHRKEWNEDPSTKTAKPEHSLSATVFKMLGVLIDTKEKEEVRDIIVNGSDQEIEDAKDRILKYGESDIKYLTQVHKAHIKEYKRLLGNDFNGKQMIKDQLVRGESMVRSAIMETVGYPINFDKVKHFSMSTGKILDEISRDINRQFPDIMPFTFDNSLNRFKQNTKAIKKWIGENYPDWKRTKTGYSLEREQWESRFKKGHSFEEGNFGSQMYRYYYTKQHLNGFQSSKSKDSTFWDYVGSDGRVRPWLNPYRAQSSRFQPSATGFIPLKASWMRSLIEPKKGRLISSIDYGSEEFLISALLSDDKKMIEAYLSGDVYLAFAKEAGMVPPDATKHTHPNERQIAKAVVLGISYGLTKFGLSVDLGCSLDKAQEYIDKFNSIYHVFYNWKNNKAGYYTENEQGWKTMVKGEYQKNKRLRLPCGWTMWGDNTNNRSVGNFTVQGTGASILRKAIEMCQDSGLDVIYPLHDALYIEIDNDENVARNLELFGKCMIDAFKFYFDDKDNASKIRIDYELWGYDEPTEVTLSDGTVVNGETIHIDERGANQYEQYKKYFEADTAMEEL